MPTVGNKKYAYTAKGKAAAKKAAAKATPTNKQPKKKPGPVRATPSNKQPIPPKLLARLKKMKAKK